MFSLGRGLKLKFGPKTVITDFKIQFCKVNALEVWLDSSEVIALRFPNFSQKFQMNTIYFLEL